MISRMKIQIFLNTELASNSYRHICHELDQSDRAKNKSEVSSKILILRFLHFLTPCCTNLKSGNKLLIFLSVVGSNHKFIQMCGTFVGGIWIKFFFTAHKNSFSLHLLCAHERFKLFLHISRIDKGLNPIMVPQKSIHPFAVYHTKGPFSWKYKTI